MKKIFILSCFLAGTLSALAQPGYKPSKTVPTPKIKTVPKQIPVLKNYNDSISYVLGEMSAFNIIQQGFGDVKINTTAFSRAITDIFDKKQTLISDIAANTLLNQYMMKLQETKAKPRVDSGKVFLAENAKRKEVKTTSTGLQYEVITEGTGIKPTSLDTFVAHYKGTLINGYVFDASANRGVPLTMAMNQVIPGWTEGLQLMSVGSKYKLYVPYTLGYGLYDNGAIPGGSTLIFEIELLDVKKHAGGTGQ